LRRVRAWGEHPSCFAHALREVLVVTILPKATPRRALQLFQPDPAAVYSLEAAAQLAHVPRRTILIYCKHGLVSPAGDPAAGGYYFSAEAIRALRRIQSLRAICGNDLAGIQIILELTKEVQRLRATMSTLQAANAIAPEDQLTLLAS
jgi:DNA-binding transcriptional MerR regulator